jgi:hypothetical protein
MWRVALPSRLALADPCCCSRPLHFEHFVLHFITNRFLTAETINFAKQVSATTVLFPLSHTTRNPAPGGAWGGDLLMAARGCSCPAAEPGWGWVPQWGRWQRDMMQHSSSFWHKHLKHVLCLKHRWQRVRARPTAIWPGLN